jgi:hypothetical protein
MVGLTGETSNRLFEILADWNDILKGTSLGSGKPPEPPPPANDEADQGRVAATKRPSKQRGRA